MTVGMLLATILLVLTFSGVLSGAWERLGIRPRTAGAWLLPCAIGLLAIVTEPQLRLASCAVLFAMAGAAAYPVTGEILLPMVAALALCLLALFDLLGMFDGLREGGLRRE